MPPGTNVLLHKQQLSDKTAFGFAICFSVNEFGCCCVGDRGDCGCYVCCYQGGWKWRVASLIPVAQRVIITLSLVYLVDGASEVNQLD